MVPEAEPPESQRFRRLLPKPTSEVKGPWWSPHPKPTLIPDPFNKKAVELVVSDICLFTPLGSLLRFFTI